MINWHDYFYYDEGSITGLRWKIRVVSGRNGNQINVEAGDVAGSLPAEDRYHSVVCIDNKHYLTHRVVYEMFNGEIEEGYDIDHIDGNSRNNKIENLRPVKHVTNMRNCKKRSDNKTGVTGVFRFTSRHGTNYFSAVWKALDGKQRSKTFSTTKYGDADAFRLACEYREKMIEELNNQGAGYTERHGT